jgi:hypothetical protein
MTDVSLRTGVAPWPHRCIGIHTPVIPTDELRDSSLREVRNRADLSAVGASTGAMNFSAAAEVRDTAGADVELLALGVL